MDMYLLYIFMAIPRTIELSALCGIGADRFLVSFFEEVPLKFWPSTARHDPARLDVKALYTLGRAIIGAMQCEKMAILSISSEQAGLEKCAALCRPASCHTP